MDSCDKHRNDVELGSQQEWHGSQSAVRLRSINDAISLTSGGTSVNGDKDYSVTQLKYGWH
ncbi:MAG: hypothetical protein JKX93_17075 [Rhizobiaceae bacterium]|nr:hypothetical protein [Rhizobiaceae bacterium]